MILAMAVIMGFKREVARKAGSAHVAVTDPRSGGTRSSGRRSPQRACRREIRRTGGFVAMAPYAVNGGIVQTADAMGVMLKGVDGGLRLVVFP